MTFNRKALSGTALAVLAVLFVAVMLLVNVVFRGARVDLTQNHLYTLSDGTKKIIGSLDEPINLYLYFSDKGTQDIPQLRTYYTRVREMLEEMASRSGGKIKLEMIDPLPFSEDEDRAASFGLQSVPVGNAGEKIFFGLAG
ncbi:MAG TPA: GldG family protein, partial [Rhodanobacteraceae bacterium]|nr:GldG family protein [Rhodanobacteraceae bacterium]